MSDIAIRVENLSKRYRIGLKEELPDTLFGAMRGWLKSPLSNFRQLRQLSHFSENGHDPEDVIWALKHVSFEVKRGEVVGIIGRNGAGKSTLLKILSRITDPTSGRAIIDGRVSSLLEVGTGFHPELTGRENIYLNGTILGMRKAEVDRKFDEIVDFSGVEKFIDTPVKRYSSGMQVRLAFSVAAHLEPEILLIDEVLAVGDAEFQQKCLGKMNEVSEGGRTVLFVSHQMGAIRKLCPRSILLKDSHIQLDSITNVVLDEYLNLNIEDMPSTGLILLPSQPNSTGQAIQLQILNSAGEPRSQFGLREPWQIVLEFELYENAPHVIVAVSLSSIQDATPIVTIWSEPSNLSAGRYCVKFDIDIPLASSRVQFTIGLSSRERAFYYVTAIGNVLITDIAYEGGQPLRSTSKHGLLIANQSPAIKKLELL